MKHTEIALYEGISMVKPEQTYRQTTQLLKLKILYKESIAEYLKQKNKSLSWKIKWWK